jgi:rfaE bifunctional protein nucleotidyltransferase chain/domain
MRNPQHAIVSLAAAVAWREALRASGGTLAITNGCFDLKHRGHDEFLYRAEREADALLVLLNSDASVAALKGPDRPVHRQQDRAYSLASLAAVSVVVVFAGTDCAAELRELRPDTYVKSEEYRVTQHPEERAVLAACGARVVWLPRLPGLSSSAAIAATATHGSHESHGTYGVHSSAVHAGGVAA